MVVVAKRVRQVMIMLVARNVKQYFNKNRGGNHKEVKHIVFLSISIFFINYLNLVVRLCLIFLSFFAI